MSFIVFDPVISREYPLAPQFRHFLVRRRHSLCNRDCVTFVIFLPHCGHRLPTHDGPGLRFPMFGHVSS